jgi:hypothetical protein
MEISRKYKGIWREFEKILVKKNSDKIIFFNRIIESSNLQKKRDEKRKIRVIQGVQMLLGWL